MNHIEFRQRLNTLVNEARGSLSASELIAPMVASISSILAILHVNYGTNVDSVLDMLKHELDQETVNYIHAYRCGFQPAS